MGIFVRYCIAGVWHRVEFVRAEVARRFYGTVAALVPRHASAVEYHDPALPAPIRRLADVTAVTALDTRQALRVEARRVARAGGHHA